MPRDGRLAARLESALAGAEPAIAKCIEKAPPWREAWPKDAATQFSALLCRKTEPLQATTPRL